MLSIGTMLASFQSEDTWPRFREVWNILISTGMSSSCCCLQHEGWDEVWFRCLVRAETLETFADSCFTDCDFRHVWERALAFAEDVGGVLINQDRLELVLHDFRFADTAGVAPKACKVATPPKSTSPTAPGYVDNYHRRHQTYTYSSRLSS